MRYSQYSVITVPSQQASRLSCPQNINSTQIRRLFLPAKSPAIYTDQFVFLNQKINGICQHDTGVYMLLNNTFIAKRRIV